MQFRPYWFLVLLIAAACSSIKPHKAPSMEAVELPSTTSYINVPIVFPLSYLEDNLNKDWSSQLFSDKGLPVGNGMKADLDVKRTGKIQLSAGPNNTLKVKAPMNLKGDFQIERKIFGQNLSTNFPFNENLIPEISFIPEIGRNWDIQVKNLQIESWGKSLKYNFLGFEIDLDKVVKSQLQKVLDNQLSASGLTRFDFKSMAQETWDAFSEPYSVDQEGMLVHFYGVPSKIRVKEEITMDQKLSLYLGIEGNMYSVIGQKPNPPKVHLPNIYYNEDKSNILDLTLPLALPFKELDSYLNQAMGGKQIRTDKNTVVIPSNLRTQQYGEKILLTMDFKAIRKGKNEIKGQFLFAGKPVFDESSESLILESPQFDVKTPNVPARLAINSKKPSILRQVKKMAAYPLADFLRDTRREMQQQGYFDTDFASFRVRNPNLDIEGIYVTAEDVKVFLRTKGEMEVRLK